MHCARCGASVSGSCTVTNAYCDVSAGQVVSGTGEDTCTAAGKVRISLTGTECTGTDCSSIMKNRHARQAKCKMMPRLLQMKTMHSPPYLERERNEAKLSSTEVQEPPDRV